MLLKPMLFQRFFTLIVFGRGSAGHTGLAGSGRGLTGCLAAWLAAWLAGGVYCLAGGRGVVIGPPGVHGAKFEPDPDDTKKCC